MNKKISSLKLKSLFLTSLRKRSSSFSSPEDTLSTSTYRRSMKEPVTKPTAGPMEVTASRIPEGEPGQRVSFRGTGPEG